MNTLRLLPLAALSLLSAQALADDNTPATTPPPADTSSAAAAPADASAATPPADASAGAPAAASSDASAGAPPADASAAAPAAPANAPSTSESPPIDTRFYIAPMGAVSIMPDRDQHTGYGAALALGKPIMPHLAVEFDADYLYYKGKQTTTPGTGLLCGLLGTCPSVTTGSASQNIYSFGLGANAYLSPANNGIFAHADVEGGDRLVYNGGLGVDVPVAGPNILVRFEALYHKEAESSGGALLRLGVRLPMGPAPAAAITAPPPPVQVVPEAPAPAAPPPPAPPPCQPPAPGQPISLEGCKTGDVIVLRGVNFDFNKASLTLNAKALLDQVGDALLARKDIKVEIDGHTDGKGGVAYNQKLSERRADSVKAYLVTRGVEEGRMSTKGFGKSMPIATNDTDEGREANRRVELKVTESNGGGVESAPPEGSSGAAPADSGSAASPAPADNGGAAASPAPADSGSAAPAGSSAPASGGDTPASQSGPPGETPPSGASPQ